MNGKDVVGHVEVHLVHRAVHLAGLEHNHGNGKFVALVDALVGDKAIEQQVLRRGAHVRREHDAEVRKAIALLAFFVQVRLHGRNGGYRVRSCSSHRSDT